MTDQSQPEERRWRAPAVVLVAVLAIVLVLTGGVALVTGGAPQSPEPTPGVGTDAFPTKVLGMPVITVGDALALLDSGALEGRAVAVGGWWLYSIDFPCPYVPAFVPPLLGDCHEYQGFASRAYQYWTCDDQGGPDGCGTGGRPTGTSEMELRSMAETSGWDVADGFAFRSSGHVGAQAVVVGHAGDPRQLHCLEDARASCARQFVVDHVAWINGYTIDEFARALDDQAVMVWPQAVAATRTDGQPISITAIRLGDARTIDPRLHGVGDSVVWVVRTLRPREALGDGDPTSGVDVALVDDATGNVLASVGLELTADYGPGTIIVQATEAGASANDQVVPYYRVETLDGAGLQEMRVGEDSWTAGDPVQRSGAGLPLVVEPGDYAVRAWRGQADRDASTTGFVHDQCSTLVHVDALSVLRLEVAFPAEGPCGFVDPTFESYLDQ